MSDAEIASMAAAQFTAPRFAWVRQIGHSRMAIFGLAIIGFWTFVAFAAPWIAPFPPNQTIPLYIHYNSTACKGNVPLLSVTAVRRGNGG